MFHGKLLYSLNSQAEGKIVIELNVIRMIYMLVTVSKVYNAYKCAKMYTCHELRAHKHTLVKCIPSTRLR